AAEHLDLDECAWLDRHRQIGVRQVPLHCEAVRAAAQPPHDMAIAVHRLASVDRLVLFAAHRQGAEPPRGLAPDRAPLPWGGAEAKPGLEWIVEEPHVGAVVAVALLHPQRVEHPIAAWRDPEFAAGR